jgi:hypothetical protein
VIVKWKANADEKARQEKLRQRQVRLLAILGNSKPHIYFLFWKRVAENEKVNALKNDVKKHRKNAAVALASGIIKKKTDSVNLPLLRLAFDKIVQRPGGIVRIAIADMAKNHSKACGKALGLWKLFMLRKRHEAEIAKRERE